MRNDYCTSTNKCVPKRWDEFFSFGARIRHGTEDSWPGQGNEHICGGNS